MKPEIILAKLEQLGRCISRIEDKRPASFADFEDDLDVQDIIVLNLERAVQQCVDIGTHILVESGGRSPNTMAQTFDALSERGILSDELSKRLRNAVGFRNVAVHEYEKLSYPIVYSIITRHLNDFRDFADTVLNFIN